MVTTAVRRQSEQWTRLRAKSIRPETRTIDGLSIRYAVSEPGDEHALLFSPWPGSIYAYEPTWNRLAEHTHLELLLICRDSGSLSDVIR